MIVHDILVILTGFVIGALSGVIGVGGGIFLVPIMVLGFRLDQQLAQGTSLAAILPSSITGGATHASQGNVLWRPALQMAAGGVLGATVGAALALHLPHEILGRVFGLFLIFSAYRMWPKRQNSSQQ